MNNQEATKVCSKCQKEKPLNEFYKDVDNKDGHRSDCKICRKKIVKQYSLNNYEKIKQKNKIYNYNHKKERQLYDKQYNSKNKKEIDLYNKQYYIINKSKLILKNKEYRLKNKDKLRIGRRTYKNNKLKTNINFKILESYRSRIYHALKNNQKLGHTIKLIMCSIPELKLHIEKLWLPGMSWNNWGYGKNKWHIDHIIPCSFFNMSDPVEQYMCFRWQNLQPLWQTVNFKKGDKLQNL
jgi:hypothetical protein